MFENLKSICWGFPGGFEYAGPRIRIPREKLCIYISATKVCTGFKHEHQADTCPFFYTGILVAGGDFAYEMAYLRKPSPTTRRPYQRRQSLRESRTHMAGSLFKHLPCNSELPTRSQLQHRGAQKSKNLFRSTSFEWKSLGQNHRSTLCWTAR